MRPIMIVVALLAAVLAVPSTSASSTSDRIDGVTDFLIERARDNYLFVFERAI